uniref:Uncharacterized protein n=1 Tax=Anguilla anguilla TaxID=7936 RepID=A0A0E9PRN1_ANGAN
MFFFSQFKEVTSGMLDIYIKQVDTTAITER